MGLRQAELSGKQSETELSAGGLVERASPCDHQLWK